MPLNRKGIMKLADALVNHQKKYDQNAFGKRTEDCGTVCCLAGFCYIEEIGTRAFNKEVKLANDYSIAGGETFAENCMDAGRRQLGIRDKWPQVFQELGEWPTDLYEQYQSNGPRAHVIAALMGLERLQVNGKIGKKVRTKLPQLKAMLAKKTRA